MRLSIILFDGFTALDVVGGYDVLANLPGMQVQFVAAAPGLVATDTGWLDNAEHGAARRLAARRIAF